MAAPVSSPIRRRSRRTVVMVFVLVVFLTAAAAVTWSVLAVNDDRNKTTRVDDDGFSMSVADVRISAPAGVAEPGTQVTAAAATKDVSGAVYGAATALHDGVDISLEGGGQPQRPVQLEFDISKDVSVPDEESVFVLAYSDGQEVPDILPAQWDPTARTVTATTEHFSQIKPVRVDVGKLMEGFKAELEKVVRMTTDQPECFGEDPLAGESSIVVTAIEDQIAWPCLQLEGDKLTLLMQSNSPVTWEFSSDPAVDPLTPTAYTAAGVITAALHPYIEGGREQGILMPKETMRVEYRLADLPVRGDLDAVPAMMLVHLLATTLQAMIPDGVQWAEKVARAECLASIADVVMDDSGPANTIVTVLSCFGSVAGAGPGQITTMITTAPGALYGMVSGGLGEIVHGNDVAFEVHLDVPAESRTAASGQVHLWNLERRTGRSSGDEVDSWILQDGAAQLHPSSTSQWVGCNGAVEDTVYKLEGDYTRLTTHAALRQGTPSGMTARFEFMVDDQLVRTLHAVAGTAGEPLNIDLTGAEELTVTAATSDRCSDERLAYGTLLNATLTEEVAMPLGDVGDLAGAWEGEYTQPRSSLSDGTEMTLNLTLDGDAFSGEVSYPQIRCSGTWTEQSRTETSIVFAEKITENETGRCVDVDEITVERSPEGIHAAYRVRSITGDASLVKE